MKITYFGTTTLLFDDGTDQILFDCHFTRPSLLKYIGGSEASAVLGLNPYMSNTELFDTKTGIITPEDISSKPYVQFGVAAEPLLRELFKITYPQYEMEYVENNSWINDKYPYSAASLDGWLTERIRSCLTVILPDRLY
jgi:hypothetical protein